MNKKSIETRYNSLKKIYKIVESNKNITLVNLLKLSRSISFYLDRMNYSKYIIEEVLKKFSVDQSTLNKKNNLISFTKLKTLWVYISEEEKYSTNSYQKHEKHLVNVIDKNNDQIIVIGEKAIRFAQKHNYHILFSYKQNEITYLSQILPKIIINSFQTQDFVNLNVVINSSKIKQKHIQLLPIYENNFVLEHHQSSSLFKSNLSSHKIGQNLDEFINSELESYLIFALYTLLTESALIYEKYKLVAQNSTLNDLEEKIKFQKRTLLKAKREKEIEEISILSKKKDLLHENGGQK
ncbi:MSC_0622 family F1-like ATPase gamma subunit [Mycoplasmopsis synoviae]|uniref:ATP synthase gamma chain n=1 Tax=Mycoplasmopsis synoviae (strain 53) TaxID=262723 RepID=Q4A5U4_MYCS5|nr:F0F1 ATP synthase subunit gamma [Mycoplasmopsis synoviae]AAZ43877.1 conserved hypothetical protein [Mycoplasmopsis synoviae 53]